MIEAVFTLDSVTRIRCSRLVGTRYEHCEGLRVHAFAAMRPPFGAATPAGEINFVVADPDAIKVFANAPLGSEINVQMAIVSPDPIEPAVPDLPDQIS